MTTHLSRINALETSLDRLARQAAKTQQVDSLRDETRQLIESHHLDLLNLKAHVWGIGALSTRRPTLSSPFRHAFFCGLPSCTDRIVNVVVVATRRARPPQPLKT